MKKCTILCNPNSGSNNKDKIINDFTKLLKENNYEANVIYTKYSGHAKEIVKDLKNTDLLISLGGDGTFNEVVTGNMQREEKLLLSHIPLGTANDLGAMFGMGKDPVNNLKLILNGVERTLDICTINGQPFVYVAGLGKFINVAYDTPRNLKKRYGYLAYLINGVKSFFQKTSLFEVTYETNGEVCKGLYSFILICNASRMGGFDFFKDVKMNDGLVEVLFSNIATKKDIIKSLYYMKTTDIRKVPGFYFFRTNHLKITLAEEPRKYWCIDGEKYKDKSKVFDIKVAGGIKMLLPKAEVKNIFIDEAND